MLKNIEEMKQRLQVSVEPKTINGVKVYVITPAAGSRPKIATRFSFMFMEGATCCSPAKLGHPEGLMMAGIGHYKVDIGATIACPRRRRTFPTALDDAVAVYKDLL